MDKNLPADAGDMSAISGSGRIHVLWSSKARVPQVRSLRSRAREPQLMSLCVCSTTREATTMRSPLLQKRVAPHHRN